MSDSLLLPGVSYSFPNAGLFTTSDKPAAVVAPVAAAAASSPWSSLLGVFGQSAATFAETYAAAEAKKLAGVSSAPAATVTTPTAPAKTGLTMSSPLVIGGLVVAAGVVLVLALRD